MFHISEGRRLKKNLIVFVFQFIINKKFNIIKFHRIWDKYRFFNETVFHILKKKVEIVGNKIICLVEFWIKIYTFFTSAPRHMRTYRIPNFIIPIYSKSWHRENNILKFQINSNIKISKTYAFLPKLPSSISIIFFAHIGYFRKFTNCTTYFLSIPISLLKVIPKLSWSLQHLYKYYSRIYTNYLHVSKIIVM